MQRGPLFDGHQQAGDVIMKISDRVNQCPFVLIVRLSMKFKLQVARVIAIVLMAGSWLSNFSAPHKMPITRTASGLVDRDGKPCTEADYRNGKIAVGAFLVGIVTVIITSFMLAPSKKEEAEAADEAEAKAKDKDKSTN